MQDQLNKDYRFQNNALLALQEMCEDYLVGVAFKTAACMPYTLGMAQFSPRTYS